MSETLEILAYQVNQNCLLKCKVRQSENLHANFLFCKLYYRTNVFLFGGYHKGLSCSSYSFSWDRQKFIQNQKPGLQAYLRSLLGQDGVQYLERVRVP